MLSSYIDSTSLRLNSESTLLEDRLETPTAQEHTHLVHGRALLRACAVVVLDERFRIVCIVRAHLIEYSCNYLVHISHLPSDHTGSFVPEDPWLQIPADWKAES